MSNARLFGCSLLIALAGVAVKAATGQTSCYFALSASLTILLIIGDAVVSAIKAGQPQTPKASK